MGAVSGGPTPPYRALVLGVDGATFDVIDPLVAAGRMPALAALMRDGVRARLRSTCPPVSAPAWVTFLTGKQPGRHGVFNFQNLDARPYSGVNDRLLNSSSSYSRGAPCAAAAPRGRVVRPPLCGAPTPPPPGAVRRGGGAAGPPPPARRRAYARPADIEHEIGPVSTLTNDQVAAAKRARD